MYEIWNYFKPETRKVVAEKDYSPMGHYFLRTYIEEGVACPLGVALILEDLQLPNHPPGWKSYRLTPDASAVSAAVLGKHIYDTPVYRAAKDFINDWDRGAITDLKEALGVEDSG